MMPHVALRWRLGFLWATARPPVHQAFNEGNGARVSHLSARACPVGACGEGDRWEEDFVFPMLAIRHDFVQVELGESLTSVDP